MLSLVDWRLHGRLSRQMIDGFFKGELGSPLLVLPGRLLPIQFILLMGLGEREGFGKAEFEGAVARVFEIQKGLKTRRTAMALPGRQEDRLPPETAMEWFIEVYDRHTSLVDEIFLIESPSAQKAMTPALERWRLRRLIPGFNPA